MDTPLHQHRIFWVQYKLSSFDSILWHNVDDRKNNFNSLNNKKSKNQGTSEKVHGNTNLKENVNKFEAYNFIKALRIFFLMLKPVYYLSCTFFLNNLFRVSGISSSRP